MKKLLAVLTAVLLLCTAVPLGALPTLSVSAATSGTTGDCTWVLDGTHLTISGNGAMGDYYGTYGPWGGNITSVTIAEGVTTIGESAFYFCTSLTSVTIPNSVTTIGDWVFAFCVSLTSVTIPGSVIYIGEDAFSNCTSLISAIIPQGVTTIEDSAFRKCKSLTSVAILGNVTFIGDYAFDGCASLTAVTIPNSVTTIGRLAFRKCESLTSVTIPDNVTSIGESAFEDCSSLTSVNIPDGVTTIGDWVFDDCVSLTAVTIHNGVTSIGEYAFSGCRSLTSVTIPDSVTSIGRSAFDYCTSLVSVTIPDSVTTIGDGAFASCTSLSSIAVSTANSHYSSMDGVLFNKEQASLIQCPGGKSGAYSIPNGITTIGRSAFEGCAYLTSVTIGNSVTIIGEYAFYFCTALTAITIPDSVTTIEYGAFSDCTSLTSVIIPDSVTTIGDYAFYYCTALTDVYYRGSEADRANISIGEENYNLINATWHYNYVPACDHVYDNDADPDCNACGALRWAVCPDTDVTIRNEDGTVLPAGTTLTVSAVEIDESDVNLDEKTTLVQVYDISLLLNGQEVQPDGVAAVTLPAPADAARYTDLQVVYIDAEGNATPCETVVNEDGTITFYTDHFSYYAIVGTPAVVYGDANGDGAVNNRDVALLQQYINKWEVVLDMTAADANGDGAVNNRDVALLQQYINKWDVELG